MKKVFSVLSLLGFICSTPCFCASTALQTITMTVASISNITTTGNPATLAVSISPDGTGSATDSSTSYTVTSNTGATGTLKVTGAITAGGAMPSNTALTLNLASRAGTSQGVQTLSVTPVDLVTRLPTLLSDTGVITYAFSVTNGWTVPAQSLNRTVTLTLTSGS